MEETTSRHCVHCGTPDPEAGHDCGVRSTQPKRDPLPDGVKIVVHDELEYVVPNKTD